MLLTLIAVIFVFGLLVLVHELGHFITAKLTGMRVDEFAIGFGPKIFSRKYGETEYSLRAVPLGGFNDIAGMDPSTNTAGKRGYCERPIASRMIVILAGSTMNLLMPLILFFGIFFFSGVSTPSNEPVLGTVLEGKAAAEAGLQNGDRIVAIDGTPIDSWQAFVEKVQNVQQPLNVEYQRDGQNFSTTLTPVYDSSAQKSLVGVMSAVTTVHPGFVESVQLAFEREYTVLKMMISGIADLFMRRDSSELAGPIGIVQMTGQFAQAGLVPLLNFTAFLSMNLGILNLFPIPALDGGHFVVLLIEAVRGKPMGEQALINIQKVGIALILLLMIIATKNDIVRVIWG